MMLRAVRHFRLPKRSTAAIAVSVPQQLRNYSNTSPLYKISKIHSDLTDEEAEELLEEELRRIEEEEQAKFVKDWKPGMRKRPLQVAYDLKAFEEELSAKDKWTLRDKRCGALAIKLGMMPVWDAWGERHACTVLHLDHNIVVGTKTMERNGYMAVQVGAGERKAKNVARPVMGQFQHLQDMSHPPYLVREFRVTDESHLLEIGSSIHARHFVPGQNVDIAGISKGKGFQGAMKLHGFGGMPASHGVSKSHRALGSTGQCQDPGKVFKGKKMAGRMGTNRVTVQNLRLVKIDCGRNLLYIKGAIPGNKGEFVEIRDAIKKPLWGTDKVLDGLERPPLPTFDYVQDEDGTGEPGLEEFMPLPRMDPLAPIEQEAA